MRMKNQNRIDSSTSKNFGSTDQNISDKNNESDWEDEVNLKSIRNNPVKEISFKSKSKIKKNV